MPKGEATREGIEALMSATNTLEVLRDDEGEYIHGYDPGVYGVILKALDANGAETGRMIAQICAVTTRQEEDEASARFAEMNK